MGLAQQNPLMLYIQVLKILYQKKIRNFGFIKFTNEIFIDKIFTVQLLEILYSGCIFYVRIVTIITKFVEPQYKLP